MTRMGTKMGRRLALSLLSAGAMVLGGGRDSTAQPVAQPYPNGFSCPASGLTMQTLDGYTIIYRGADPADPEVCLWDSTRLGGTAPGSFLYALHNVRDHTIRLDQMRTAYRAIFPLAIGKKYETVANGDGFKSSLRLVLTVESIDDLKIGAETHKAWLIHQEGFGTFGNDIDLDNRYWLDVDTFALLKLAETTNGKAYSFEAVSLRAPAQGTPVAPPAARKNR